MSCRFYQRLKKTWKQALKTKVYFCWQIKFFQYKTSLRIYNTKRVNWLTSPRRILHPQQVFHQRVCQSVVHVVASCQAACQLVDDPPPDLPAAGVPAVLAAPVGGPFFSCLQNRNMTDSTKHHYQQLSKKTMALCWNKEEKEKTFRQKGVPLMWIILGEAKFYTHFTVYR